MFEERDIRFDLIALAALVFVVFLGLSLATYSPADPSVELVYPFNKMYEQDVLAYPVSETTTNACGRWGSVVSSALFDAFGIGAYYLTVSLGALAILVLMHREIDSPALRVAGWIASLVGMATLSTMFLPNLCSGTVMGPGGWFGALGAGILQYYFADVGGFIFASSLLVGGLLLCTDYVLVHVGLMVGALTMTGVLGRRTSLRSNSSELAENDVDGDFEDEEEQTGVAVRVGGRKIRLLDEEELEEGDEEEEEEEEDEEEEDGYEDASDEEDEVEEEGDDEEYESDDEENVEADADADESAPTLMRGRNGRRRLAPFRVRRPPEPEDRDVVMSQLDEASMREDDADYRLPGIDLLKRSPEFSYDAQTKEVRRKAKVLEKTFRNFGFDVKVVEIETGPVIAQYEVELEAGLRLSKITGLADDLAIALRVPSVRIVAPIPGKNTVGIEVPNEERQLVHLREVMTESAAKTKKMSIPVFLGKDVSGNPLTVDLATLPHLLIAGRTGTGKSVCLNAIIASMLMTRRPDEVRMLMIDPKMVELSGYKSLPHLMHPVVTDMRKAEAILAWAVDKMEERYSILAQAGVRHVTSYNRLSEEELIERLDPQSEEERRAIPLHMPFIVIVADEIADLMMTSGKEVEQHIIRLAQKSRAVGIHLILATQKPTVDVITGLIKSNLPARIAFQVASRTDSRVVLDEMGADKLLGNGDMLFLYPGTSTLMRGQGTYVDDDEINRIVAEASQGEQNFVDELVHLKIEDNADEHSPKSLKSRDDLYEQAIEIVVREGRGSCSLLQRALGIGYGRAARLIDFMAEDGVVGPYAGSQAREVLMTMASLQAIQKGESEGESAKIKSTAPSAKKRKPKIADESDDDSSSSNVLSATMAVVKSNDTTKAADEENDDDDLEEEEEHDNSASEVKDEVDSEIENEAEEENEAEAEEEEEEEEDSEEEEYEEEDALEEDEEYEYVYEDDPDAEAEDEEYEYVYEEEEVDEKLEESA